ncbi:hypothetical protein KFL_000230410 [Klebsormidium nitens]|uniref:CST complex subunit CTC1 n=1 Tax=Klebsormidium nitens TaxID=105231 RepID=A0A1Y1HM44_KLENI|nr:hypothetical protein KFL_000230410 [Klebsormidium nitens]|eukprot:GAQ79063.1 hypothetical protein KFL_000230410 [Klebsormidium nitens]
MSTMELPNVDVFYDSDGAGPCTQAPWNLLPSPLEDAPPDGSASPEGVDAIPAPYPLVTSQAPFETFDGNLHGGQSDEGDGSGDKGPRKLASFADLRDVVDPRTLSRGGSLSTWTPQEVPRLGELVTQPVTQRVTTDDGFSDDDPGGAKEMGVLHVEREGSPGYAETPLPSSGVQNGAGVKSSLGGKHEALSERLPNGDASSGITRVGRRGGESLDGTIVAVSPVIDIRAASKPGQEHNSFFLLDLQLPESTPVFSRGVGQAITGSACCGPRAQREAGRLLGGLVSAGEREERPVGTHPPAQVLTAAERAMTPKLAQPEALMSEPQRAFLYFEGAPGVKWREVCVAKAGRPVRFTGLRRRTMVVGSQGTERMVYVPGSNFGMDLGGHSLTVSAPSGGLGCETTEGANGRAGCPLRGVGARQVAKGEGGEGGVPHGGVQQGTERPPQGESPLPNHQRDRQCAGGPSDGQRSSEVRELAKGLPQNGTLCYVGVVSAVWSSGLVIELDRKLNLLLTHYPATELPGLRVGALLATWLVHPILRGGQVIALGACTHSLVTVLGSPNPTGSEAGLAGRGHPLRQLCDRLPFSVASWVGELERSLRAKLGGVSDRSVPTVTKRISSGLHPVRKGVDGLGNCPDGLGIVPADKAARSKAPETLPPKRGRAPNVLNPSLQSLTDGSGDYQPASANEGSGARGSVLDSGSDCRSLLQEVLVHLLPGCKDLRQRWDVFEEFMSHDTECKLGVDPVGWKTPPKVPTIAAVLGEVRKRGQGSGRRVERLSGDELGAKLLGYLTVDACSGRAVLSDATGSVRVEVKERLEAVHLGRWLLVTRFSADVRAASDSGPDNLEPSVSFSLADALLVIGPPPLTFTHEMPPNPYHKTLAEPVAYGRGTWLRTEVRKRTRTASAPSVGRGAATWQKEGGGTALQPLNWRGNAGCAAAGGSSKQAGGTPFWMVSVILKSAVVRGERGLQFAAEAVLLPRVLILLDPKLGALGGISTSVQRSGFEADVEATFGGFRFPRDPRNWRHNPHHNPQLPEPRSGLVRSYHRAKANEVREKNGPPWLVRQAGTAPGSAAPSDGCLFTPAWERRHRPIQTALTRPLAKCTAGPSQPAPRGGSPLDDGAVPTEPYGRRVLHLGAGLIVVPNPFNANPVWGMAKDGQAVRTGLPMSGPCPSVGATVQSLRMKTADENGAQGFGHRTVIGAAAAARSADIRPPKRPKVSGTERPESAQCFVYSQRLNVTGRADQELERGPPVSAVLERREPLGSAAGSEARVLLTFAGEAALLYDFLHVGNSYLIPAQPLAPKRHDPDLNSTVPTLPPRNYSQSRLPVIDLTERESVHSFRFVSSEAGTGSETGETSERSVAESANGAQASLLVQVPEPVYREVLPIVGASLRAGRTKDCARGAGGKCDAAKSVKLRGRVVAVLELQLAWGCPFCGAQSHPTSEARTVCSGCVRCCADESQYTVLLREACFSFDDGASQCELWAEGSAAADLLCLPYVPADPLVCSPNKATNPIPAKQNSAAHAADFLSTNNMAGSVISLGNNRSHIQPSQEPSSSVQLSANAAFKFASATGLYNPAPHVTSDPRQQAAAVTSPSAHGVKRLRTSDLDSTREALLESVKRRQRQGNSKAAQYEPATLFGHLHRCLLDPSTLEALVRREGLVRVRVNPEGAADGSFQAAQREMTGERTGQLSGPNREVLEVLLGNASRQSQKILTCAPLPRSSADRSRFLSKEQSEASRGGRCRVYLSGQVYEIYAPVIAAYRVLVAEPVSASVEAESLCRQLTLDSALGV